MEDCVKGKVKGCQINWKEINVYRMKEGEKDE